MQSVTFVAEDALPPGQEWVVVELPDGPHLFVKRRVSLRRVVREVSAVYPRLAGDLAAA